MELKPCPVCESVIVSLSDTDERMAECWYCGANALVDKWNALPRQSDLDAARRDADQLRTALVKQEIELIAARKEIAEAVELLELLSPQCDYVARGAARAFIERNRQAAQAAEHKEKP